MAGDTASVTIEHLLEMAYGESNGHMTQPCWWRQWSVNRDLGMFGREIGSRKKSRHWTDSVFLFVRTLSCYAINWTDNLLTRSRDCSRRQRHHCRQIHHHRLFPRHRHGRPPVVPRTIAHCLPILASDLQSSCSYLHTISQNLLQPPVCTRSIFRNECKKLQSKHVLTSTHWLTHRKQQNHKRWYYPPLLKCQCVAE